MIGLGGKTASQPPWQAGAGSKEVGEGFTHFLRIPRKVFSLEPSLCGSSGASAFGGAGVDDAMMEKGELVGGGGELKEPASGRRTPEASSRGQWCAFATRRRIFGDARVSLWASPALGLTDLKRE